MNTFKRLKTTISASIESLASEIENQQAIAQASLKEFGEILSELKINIYRLEVRKNKMEKDIARIEKQQKQWQKRAQEMAPRDKETARKCIKKVLELKSEKEDLKGEMEKLEKRALAFSQEKKKVEYQYYEFQKEVDILSLRESKSKSTHYGERNPSCEMTDVLRRWEEKLIREELKPRPQEDFLIEDDLEQTFLKKEFEEQIEEELNKLLKDV